MARGKYGETLQAVEINSSSVIGVISNIGGAGSQVHILEDGDLIFHFDGIDKQITAYAGSDFVAGPGCIGITSQAKVILS
jgi:hypothetical protein